jgi:hypothetical protein
MSSQTLVGELFDGPIDVIGDVHGEVVALHELRRRLGYDERGRHPHGRRLVFVGDLGDRGPDSPGAVEWIRELVERGRAQAVLGNHDFNALHAAAGGPMKTELSWLFDEARPFHHHGHHVPQVLVRGKRRDGILAFFARLPLALVRGGELPVRVVHACWDADSIECLRGESNVIACYQREHSRIAAALGEASECDPLARKLAHQNGNPVKRVTSGLEGRSSEPIFINNEPRYEVRLPWWRDYHDATLCVFGHYWRTALPGERKFEDLFDGVPRNGLVGPGGAMCIDYSVGKRFKERMRPGFAHRYLSSLAALRLPERVLVFDNADPLPVVAEERTVSRTDAEGSGEEKREGEKE